MAHFDVTINSNGTVTVDGEKRGLLSTHTVKSAAALFNIVAGYLRAGDTLSFVDGGVDVSLRVQQRIVTEKVVA